MGDDNEGFQVLEKGMQSCYQTHGLNMLDHGLSVWKYTSKLLNGDTAGMKIPSWYTEHKSKILENIHDLETIRLYNIYHDCGKHLCRTVDIDGKVHYPNHAEVSKQAWLDVGGDSVVAELIGLDMVMHTENREQIQARGLTKKTLFTLLLTALAECHANAELFGGIESTSFKIKWKKLDKMGKFLCANYL